MGSLRYIFAGVIALCPIFAAAQSPRIRQTIDGSQATTLRGSVHYLAQAQFDRGPVSPSLRIQGASIIFNRSASQQKDLNALIAQQQDPASPNYQRWLTSEEFADRFGMNHGDIDKVTAWLTSQGLTVDRVANSRTQIYFSGSAARIEQALHTQLHQFVVNGETHFANANEPAVPSAMAGSVLAVRNLNDFRIKPRKLKVRKVSAQPRFEAGGGNHFISPDDLATIYNLKPLYTQGIDGESPIAVAGQTQISQADISAFRSASGLSANPVQMVLVPKSGTSTTVSGDELEADLDVEWSGAVARNAKIIYVYTGNGNLNVIDAMQYAIDNRLAPVVSISYGLCEAQAGQANLTALQTLAQEAISKGITISSASGDEGAADCEDANALSATHGLAVDAPSAIPEVTGVGGTEFNGDVSSPSSYWLPTNTSNNASAISYIPETGWNDTTLTVASGDGLAAGGGGVSTFFGKPAWQTGAGVPADGKRDVPDIALDASARHDGYLICSGGNCVNGFVASDNTLTLVGGTSVGAPIFAGVVGLINQAAQTNGQGNVNIRLYALAASTPAAFHDTTTGDNKVPCTAGSAGCTSANSHLVATGKLGWVAASSGMLFFSFIAICLPSRRRRRWIAASAPFLIVFMALGIGCGGGSSSSSTPSTPTPPVTAAVSIGFSAATGYDLATGLGSIDAGALVSAWPGVPAAPSFTISASPSSLTAAAGQPAISSLTVSSTTGFTGTIALSCAPATPNSQVSCSIAPTSVALSNGTISAPATLTTSAPSGSYAIVVKGTDGSVFQFENLSLTSQ